MDASSTSLLAALISLLVSGLTVFLADFFGLRRDRARLRMEFDWQLRRQRWDALHQALANCPALSIEQDKLMASIFRLTKWCQTEVEPWLGSERIQRLREKRETVEQWLNDTVAKHHCSPAESSMVPSAEINELRNIAIQEVTESLRRMRTRFSELSQNSNL